MYEVVYSDEVLLSIKKYKKSSPQSYKKVVKLINELHRRVNQQVQNYNILL